MMRLANWHTNADLSSETADDEAISSASDVTNDAEITPKQPNAACVLDANGHLVLVSVPARGILGLGHAYAPGTHWLDAWPHENHTLLDHALDRAQSGEPIQFSVFRSDSSGRSCWIRICMAPLAAPAQAHHKIHVTLRDITAEKSAESQKYRFEM